MRTHFRRRKQATNGEAGVKFIAVVSCNESASRTHGDRDHRYGPTAAADLADPTEPAVF
jgi:hypothetical protein